MIGRRISITDCAAISSSSTAAHAGAGHFARCRRFFWWTAQNISFYNNLEVGNRRSTRAATGGTTAKKGNTMRMRLDQKRFLRACKVYSQEAIGDHLGTTQQNAGRILRAVDKIRLQVYLDICEFLDEHPSTFLIETKRRKR